MTCRGALGDPAGPRLQAAKDPNPPIHGVVRAFRKPVQLDALLQVLAEECTNST
jgi:hypothetical protein